MDCPSLLSCLRRPHEALLLLGLAQELAAAEWALPLHFRSEFLLLHEALLLRILMGAEFAGAHAHAHFLLQREREVRVRRLAQGLVVVVAHARVLLQREREVRVRRLAKGLAAGAAGAYAHAVQR